MTILADPPRVGPLLVEQVIPLTPMIDQLPVPVGVCPPTGPVTVAVKVKVEPKVALADEVVTVTVGALCAITNENGLERSLAAK